MADKTFHLRANEVRAESRALMQKLRAERLAKTRHRQHPAVPTVAVVPAAPVEPVRMTIIASRKIQAAVEPVAIAPADEVRAALTETTPVPAEDPKAKRAAPRARKPKPVAVAATPETTETVVEAPLVPPTDGPVAEEPADVIASPAEPEPAELAPAELAPVEVREPKAKAPRKPKVPIVDIPAEPVLPPVDVEAVAHPTKPKRARKTTRSVVEIIEQGLGSVAELQEAVATAIAAAPEKVSMSQTLPQSPRARESISSIPTLGPGMIWRLNQLGIRTLGDMANMDEDELRNRLGPVAKLVRVEAWISYAKAA